ncbi:GNAT family N-acetyltransferase [Methanothrix sp.]|uniref:GNAT family N-acetyltransferase n=1 Tax=Methanothrix sp. TaxID=90426 RepID=UPI003BB6C837
MSQFEIVSLSDDSHQDYNDFLKSNEVSTIFHTLEWKKVIEETFNYKPEYILIKNGKNELVGLSPSFCAKTLHGKIIVSQPFFEYGGPLVQQGASEAINEIGKFYKDKLIKNRFKYVELRTSPNVEFDQLIATGFVKQFKAYDFYIDIKGKDFENDIWFGLYTKKSRVRNSVNKAISSGIRVIESRDTDIYYKLYIDTVERLGSPPYPRTLFENIDRFLGPSVRFTYAYLGNRPIAAMMSFLYEKRDLMVGLVSDDAYNEYRPNDLLYNEQIMYATKNNFHIVDFGRTRPNSFYERYKKKWGSSKIDLYSYVYPPTAAKEINPYNIYLSMSRITIRIPWILTRTGLGPFIIKRFP